MMNRRAFLRTTALTSAGFGLAGCASLGIPISIVLPPEVQKFVDAANLIIARVTALAPAAVDLIAQARAYVTALTSGTGTLKGTLGALAKVLAALLPYLPAPYNLAASAVVMLINAYVGLAASTRYNAFETTPTMTIDQALVILAR